jgi:catechol 2,3-dioxygenase-like lactoylglutathione lyase family enzyme
MLSHIFVSVSNFERAFAFYDAVMCRLGNELRFSEPERPWAGWHSEGRSRPFFVICKPHDGQPHDPGNGQMVAFLAASREQVRAAYQAGLAHGGTCEGPPGLRPQYHANYYGAYVRDPEGNKLAMACHSAH